MKIKSDLRIGDYICTTSRSPIAMVIRTRTAGIRHIFNGHVTSHVGQLVRKDGMLKIAEMMPKGLEINELDNYSGKDFWNTHVVCVRRNPVYDHAKARERLNARIIKDWKKGIKYDYKGLVEYLWPKVEDCPKKFYCSEYLQRNAILDGNPIVSDDPLDDDISPYGIQKAHNLLVA